MITKNALQDRIESGPIPIKDRYEKLSVKLFSGNDFDFDKHQVIFIAKGRKEDFTDAIDFWLQSILSYCVYFDRQIIEHGYLNANLIGECKKIPFSQAKAIIEEALSTLQDKYNFDWPVQFTDAVLMTDDWNDKSLVMECKQEVVTFQWFTTA